MATSVSESRHLGGLCFESTSSYSPSSLSYSPGWGLSKQAKEKPSWDKRTEANNGKNTLKYTTVLALKSKAHAQKETHPPDDLHANYLVH